MVLGSMRGNRGSTEGEPGAECYCSRIASMSRRQWVCLKEPSSPLYQQGAAASNVGTRGPFLCSPIHGLNFQDQRGPGNGSGVLCKLLRLSSDHRGVTVRTELFCLWFESVLSW